MLLYKPLYCFECIEPSPVIGLTAVSINSESIMVTWALPQYPNGPLSGYRIYYKRSNMIASPPGSDRAGYEVKTVQSGTVLECNISGLEPSTNYSLFVMAVGMHQLIGRVDNETLVLTKTGMEVNTIIITVLHILLWDSVL